MGKHSYHVTQRTRLDGESFLTKYLCGGVGYSKIKIAAAMVVVHRPRLSPTADCVTLAVRTILFEMRYVSFFSSQLLSGSKSTSKVVASISAASSSAYSPACSSVSPKLWCSLRYP